MRSILQPAKILYSTLIYIFFYLPLFVLIFLSFNNAKYSMLWHGFTWKWYQQLFQDGDIWSATLHSLIIAILASSAASIIGLLTATCLYRYRFHGRKLLHGLVFILIVAPDIVMGTALLILFSSAHLALGFWSLFLAHITLCAPFVTVTLYSRMTDIDYNIFEAAKDLGASDIIIFLRIMIPLVLPAIIAGWLLSFTLSLDDVIISYFVSGPQFQILPLQIYSMVRMGINPEINALCSIIFVVTLTLVTFAQFFLRKNRQEVPVG